mmetsp:Transcript_82023/g.248736  ORF Transcript_82023/g.248736 Transcript_82023/m.248736 type:complete len:966 (-) Transcript_82023:57-2954(-)
MRNTPGTAVPTSTRHDCFQYPVTWPSTVSPFRIGVVRCQPRYRWKLLPNMPGPRASLSGDPPAMKSGPPATLPPALSALPESSLLRGLLCRLRERWDHWRPRGMAEPPAPAKTSVAPKPDFITYVSDVEGHWEYFCNYVDISAGLKFRTEGDHRKARRAEDLELELLDGWHFVFGGDSCDKGPGTLRFLQAMVMLKRRYPERVHLLLGNRDVNKMRWTAELAQGELDRLLEVPGAYWVPQKSRKSPQQFLAQLAAQEEGIREEEVTEAMLLSRNTKANRLRFMLKCDMGSDGEFEFRRAELAHLGGTAPEAVPDEEVVESYEASLRPGGWMREYLRAAQLGLLLGDALFVHAQICDNGFRPPGVAEPATAWCLGQVPGHAAPVEDLRAWLRALNAWGEAQVRDWEARPLWDPPPRAASYEEWRGRGASELICYGTPASRVPTVVYSRFLTPKCMPLKYPPELARYLREHAVRYVVVGHTPHGHSPTVIQNDGVTVIMGDTSFSHVNANTSYKGDNRGTAVSDIAINGRVCHVRGCTSEDQIIDFTVAPDAGDEYVGRIQEGGASAQRFFVKARLPEAPGLPTRTYLLSTVQGFSYDYALLTPEQVAEALNSSGLNVITRRTISGSGDVFGHSFNGDDAGQLVEYIFGALDRDKDGRISKRELVMACTDRIVRRALLLSFPGATVEGIMKLMDVDRDGHISMDEFLQTFCHPKVCSRRLEQAGVYFELIGSGEGSSGNFPRQLGPLALVPTVGIQPQDLCFLHWGTSQGEGAADCECQLAENAFRTEALRQLRQGPPAAGQGTLLGYVSARHPLGSSEQRAALSAPQQSCYYAWSYPYVLDWGSMPSGASDAVDPDVAFLSMGGCVFFDENSEAIAMHAAMPTAGAGLAFGPPRRWKPAWTEAIMRVNRWHPVTRLELQQAGAMDFCFIGPQEVIGGTLDSGGAVIGKLGAFVYLGHGLSAETSYG